MSGGTLDSGRSHAATGLDARYRKALKIARLLALVDAPPLRILEVGTGSGAVAHWFAQRGHAVAAVDVVDERVVSDGVAFTRIAGTALPFADAMFDVVISNHVIEHVGDAPRQRAHLDELRRVMKPTGLGYLAVPNRWMLVEPHYRLAFLSWLPRDWRTPYLRWRGKGREYDCTPLSLPAGERLLLQAGFHWQQQIKSAVVAVLEIEMPRATWVHRLVRVVPDACYRACRRIFPTLIFVVRRE